MSFIEACDLTGRVALITGASTRGIGSACAKEFAKLGAKVFLTARREEKLAKMAAEIEAAGGEAGYKACDVSDEEQCKAAIEACVEKFGRLDIMVLSAGISGMSMREFEKGFDSDNWRKVSSINLDGVFYMVKHGYKECAKHGVGSIIPIVSLAGYMVNGSIAYTATKGALARLIPYWGKYMGPMGVRVNGIAPGFTDTNMTNPEGVEKTDMAAFVKKMHKDKAEALPVRREGEPEDMAYAACYLASDASSFMTGQTLIIDGGEIL